MTERVAAIYDIHGNLPALEAVLDEIARVGVDRIIVGGDVLPGPMPRETMACLAGVKTAVSYIHGNGDRVVLDAFNGIEPVSVPPAFREIIQWTARQLNAEDARAIASWPGTLRLPWGPASAGPMEVLFCHATPRNDTEIFTRDTDDARVRPAFEGVDAPLVVCGHTHMQFDRSIGSTRVINAGSVGMPYGEPGAYWLLLGADVQLRHTPYDLDAAAARIRESGYPQAEEFVRNDLRNPKSEREMRELFARVELR